MGDSEKDMINVEKSFDDISAEEMATKTAKPKKKKNQNNKSFFASLKAEFKKIIWPNSQTLVKQVAAVIASSVVLGLIITIVDLIIRFGLELIV